jgi:hypothetical protein
MLENRRLGRIEGAALKVADLMYRGKRANSHEVWGLAQEHINPAPVIDNFENPASVYDNIIWTVALINGSGRVARVPHGEAASIVVEDKLLKLQVRPDPNFDKKTQKLFDEPAAEAYNNAHLEGLRGFLPTQSQDVVYECRMRVDRLQGSTGIWVEEEKTFNPVTGIMQKPFRSFGFSWVGPSSADFIRGLSVQTVVGFAPTVRNIGGFKPTDWHVYIMQWEWRDRKTQTVKFSIDGKFLTEMPISPFGRSECQLWGDNYDIKSALRIGFRNMSSLQETQYDYVAARTAPHIRH